jgi:hypothetical protein
MEAKDHDKLIGIDTKVQILCRNIAELKNDVKNSNDKILDSIESKFTKSENDWKECRIDIYKKIDTLQKDKISWIRFVWIISILIGVIGTTAGFTYNSNLRVNQVESEFIDHAAFSTLAWEKITGEQWGSISRDQLLKAREKFKKVREETLRLKEQAKKNNQPSIIGP